MKHGLGRGFESLIPTDLVDGEFDLTASEDKKVSQLMELPIEKIVRDTEQPRKEFDEEALEALANSIREHGVLQPIVVTKSGAKYKLVAGERRWRAAQKVGLETLPAIVRTLSAQNRLELSIIENAQREDLNPIELATAYAKLKSQFNLSDAEIAKRVGKSEAAVKNTLRLLNLPEFVKKAMVEHRLPEGVVRPLITVEQEVVEAVLPKIISEGWPTKRVETYVAGRKSKSSSQVIKARQYAKEENALSEKYNATVEIKGHKLIFNCKNEAQIKELIAQLKK